MIVYDSKTQFFVYFDSSMGHEPHKHIFKQNKKKKKKKKKKPRPNQNLRDLHL